VASLVIIGYFVKLTFCFAATFCVFFAATTHFSRCNFNVYFTHLAHAVMHVHYKTTADAEVNNGYYECE
jgi:uncharacterized membrane protein YphA (DoxX/SURF4 family)